jgi:hypothetical protein
MDEATSEAENAPIATATRVPIEEADADDETDDDEYPPVLTATRVS